MINALQARKMTIENLKSKSIEPELKNLRGFEERMVIRYVNEIQEEIEQAAKQGKSSITTIKRNFQVKEILENAGYTVIAYTNFDDDDERFEEEGLIWTIIW